jgi:hypothetical protein
MLMPKTTVHLDHHSMARKHYVRPARQISPVKTKAQPECVELTPNQQLGFRVLLAAAAHYP